MGQTFKGDAALTPGEGEREELRRKSLRLGMTLRKSCPGLRGPLSLLPSKYCSPVSRGSLSLLPSKYCSLDRPCLGQKQPGSRTPTLLCHGLWAASDGITAVDLKMGQLEVVSQLRSPKVGSECNALVAIIGSYSDYCN